MAAVFIYITCSKAYDAITGTGMSKIPGYALHEAMTCTWAVMDGHKSCMFRIHYPGVQFMDSEFPAQQHADDGTDYCLEYLER